MRGGALVESESKLTRSTDAQDQPSVTASMPAYPMKATEIAHSMSSANFAICLKPWIESPLLACMAVEVSLGPYPGTS